MESLLVAPIHTHMVIMTHTPTRASPYLSPLHGQLWSPTLQQKHRLLHQNPENFGKFHPASDPLIHWSGGTEFWNPLLVGVCGPAGAHQSSTRPIPVGFSPMRCHSGRFSPLALRLGARGGMTSTLMWGWEGSWAWAHQVPRSPQPHCCTWLPLLHLQPALDPDVPAGAAAPWAPDPLQWQWWLQGVSRPWGAPRHPSWGLWPMSPSSSRPPLPHCPFRLCPTPSLQQCPDLAGRAGQGAFPCSCLHGWPMPPPEPSPGLCCSR